jgi:hypothetical protein
MDLKSVVQFVGTREDRSYTFCMPVNAPVGEVYDVLFETLTQVVEISKKNLDKMKPQVAQPQETSSSQEEETSEKN